MPFDNVAPGFYDLQDVAERRVSEIDVEQIVAAVELSARLHTQAVNEMEASFVERGTEFKERYYLPVVSEMQPLVGDTDRLAGEVLAALGRDAAAGARLQSAVEATTAGYGAADPDLRQAVLAAGASAFIDKGASSSDLLTAIAGTQQP